MIEIVTKGNGIVGGDTIQVAGSEPEAATMRELPSITITGAYGKPWIISRNEIASITVVS